MQVDPLWDDAEGFEVADSRRRELAPAGPLDDISLETQASVSAMQSLATKQLLQCFGLKAETGVIAGLWQCMQHLPMQSAYAIG